MRMTIALLAVLTVGFDFHTLSDSEVSFLIDIFPADYENRTKIASKCGLKSLESFLCYTAPSPSFEAASPAAFLDRCRAKCIFEQSNMISETGEFNLAESLANLEKNSPATSDAVHNDLERLATFCLYEIDNEEYQSAKEYGKEYGNSGDMHLCKLFNEFLYCLIDRNEMAGFLGIEMQCPLWNRYNMDIMGQKGIFDTEKDDSEEIDVFKAKRFIEIVDYDIIDGLFERSTQVEDSQAIIESDKKSLIKAENLTTTSFPST